MPHDELEQFDYELPAELLATRPSPRRDGSRLLRVDRRGQQLEHLRFDVLPQCLQQGDWLVL